ncbi:MAG: VOC family protein [Planctomycetota bacterium]|nr:VOC family protein [Planctomycetota bacterium]
MSDVIHAPGTFCWAELSTSDAAGAKSFYSELMGWETHDDPIPGAGTYTMCILEGGNVGALYELTPEMKSQGVKPHWLSYVTVESASASAGKAKELGGTVIKDAFDVFDIGSMAVLQDPTGATLALWQPKKHQGTAHTDGKPGSVCWNELATRDMDRAGKFYADLFGWNPMVKDMGPHKYTMMMNGEEQAAGILQMSEEWGEMPSHWMVYFSVANCDSSAEKAKGLGAEVKVPPTDIPPVGRFSVIQDPQGAICSIIALSAK